MSENNKMQYEEAVNVQEKNEKEPKETEQKEGVQENEKEAKVSTKKRLSKKDREIERLKKEVEELRDKYLRQVAEFENFRKRKDREVEEFWKVANAELIKKLLPILDDMERSIESAKKDKNFEALVQGIELVYKSFVKVLESEGVTQISAKGQEFDPEIHEALMQVESKDVAPNTVVEEHQKGYKLGEKILRPAKVIVSK